MSGGAAERALAYGRHGWPVSPCQPGSKVPATPHGFDNATTDAGQIRRWWRRLPDANVAIATGTPGSDVLDVDQHGRAGSGFGAFNQLRRAGLIEQVVASSPFLEPVIHRSVRWRLPVIHRVGCLRGGPGYRDCRMDCPSAWESIELLRR